MTIAGAESENSRRSTGTQIKRKIILEVGVRLVQLTKAVFLFSPRGLGQVGIYSSISSSRDFLLIIGGDSLAALSCIYFVCEM